MSSYTIVGKCSICSGNVVVPQFWNGTTPPVPTCQSCHAQKADDRPVIKMENKQPYTPRGMGASPPKRFLQD